MITGFRGGCRFDSSSGLSMWTFPVLIAVFCRCSNFSPQSKSPPLFPCLSHLFPLSLSSLSLFLSFYFFLHLFEYGVIICYLSGAFKCLPPALDVPLEVQPSVQPPLCSFTEGREWFKALCFLTFQVLHFSPSQQSSYHWERLVPYRNEEVITHNLLSITSHTHFSNSCACTSSVLT